MIEILKTEDQGQGDQLSDEVKKEDQDRVGRKRGLLQVLNHSEVDNLQEVEG